MDSKLVDVVFRIVSKQYIERTKRKWVANYQCLVVILLNRKGSVVPSGTILYWEDYNSMESL